MSLPVLQMAMDKYIISTIPAVFSTNGFIYLWTINGEMSIRQKSMFLEYIIIYGVEIPYM